MGNRIVPSILALGLLLWTGNAPTRGEEPQPDFLLKDLPGWVGAVAFTPAGELLIGTGDGTVAAWKPTTGRPKVLHRHADAVAALAVAADGKTFYSGAHDGTIRKTTLGKDVEKPALLGKQRGAVLALAPLRDGRLFSGGIDGKLREWSPTQTKLLRTQVDHTSWVHGLALDREEKLLATASSDTTLRVRSTKDLEPQHTFRVKEGEIRAAALSPDGTFAAAAIRYGHVRVWDLRTGKVTASFRPHAGETWAVAFTPDGRTLLSGGGDWNQPGEVVVWDTSTWKRKNLLPHSGEVLCLAVSADGKLLAAGGWDRSVRLWKVPR